MRDQGQRARRGEGLAAGRCDARERAVVGARLDSHLADAEAKPAAKGLAAARQDLRLGDRSWAPLTLDEQPPLIGETLGSRRLDQRVGAVAGSALDRRAGIERRAAYANVLRARRSHL